MTYHLELEDFNKTYNAYIECSEVQSFFCNFFAPFLTTLLLNNPEYLSIKYQDQDELFLSTDS